jgi:HSP90 family molecular chaperone
MLFVIHHTVLFQPLWVMDAKDVSPEMHDEFYRFVGNSYDRPRFTLHYKTDAPLTLRALLYFPEGKPGMQQEDALMRYTIYLLTAIGLSSGGSTHLHTNCT